MHITSGVVWMDGKMHSVQFSNLYNLQDLLDAIAPMQQEQWSMWLSTKPADEYVQLVELCSVLLKQCRALQVDCRALLAALAVYVRVYYSFPTAVSLKKALKPVDEWQIALHVVGRAHVLVCAAVDGDADSLQRLQSLLESKFDTVSGATDLETV